MNAPIVPLSSLLDAAPLPSTSGLPTRSRLEALSLACDRLEDIVRRTMPPSSRGGPGHARLFGALCLLSGIDFPVSRLVAAVPVALDAFDIDVLLAAMANLGFHATPTRGNALRRAQRGPQLLITAAGDPVVVFSCPDTEATKLIRPSGEIVSVADNDRIWAAARGWIFRHSDPAHPLDKVQRRHNGHSWFRALLSLFSGYGPVLLACSIALALLAMAIPLFTIFAYRQVISPGSLTALPGFVVGVALAITIEAALLFRRGRIIAFLANRLEYIVSTASMERILKLRPALSDTAVVADQAARLRSFDNVRGFLTSPSFTGLIEAPASVASVVAIAAFAGWVALVPAAGIAMHLVVFALVRRRARVTTRMAADASTEMQRIAIDTFEKRAAIRDAGIQHMWSQRIVEGVLRQQRMVSRLRMVGALGEALSACVLTATAILLLGVSAEAAWGDIVAPGALLAIMMLGMRALAPFHMLCLSIQRCEQVRNSVAQLNQLMEIAPERDVERQYSPLESLRGGVSFVNAGHRVGDTRPVFVGLDLDIAPGSAVAITGSSGSGKTTVLKMLQGMTDISLGTVRIDGVDMRQLPLDELRRRISYVPQRPRLFPGTLRENLLLANPLASDDKITAALRWVGLEDEIMAMGGGLDRTLSAAELDQPAPPFAFKFAIAQAVLVGSRLVLVDEIPNAVLDTDVGDVVRRLIALSDEGRTVVFVTQRSDFIQLAGRVVALRYGRQPLITTPKDLMARTQ